VFFWGGLFVFFWVGFGFFGPFDGVLGLNSEESPSFLWKKVSELFFQSIRGTQSLDVIHLFLFALDFPFLIFPFKGLRNLGLLNKGD